MKRQKPSRMRTVPILFVLSVLFFSSHRVESVCTLAVCTNACERTVHQAGRCVAGNCQCVTSIKSRPTCIELECKLACERQIHQTGHCDTLGNCQCELPKPECKELECKIQCGEILHHNAGHCTSEGRCECLN